MKASFYNHYINDDDNILIYNALTNAMIEDEDGKITQILSQNKDNISIEDLLNEHEIIQLRESGIIIGENYNELDIAKNLNHNRIYNLFESDRSLSFVIAPTMACNCKCFYCFEPDAIKQPKGFMSPDTQNTLLAYIEKSINGGIINEVNITWYGGEPLLRDDIVRDMQRKLYEMCLVNNVKLCTTMITNGILLRKALSEELVSIGLNRVQITLDGSERTHNKRRFFPEAPESNFKRTVENIRHIPEQIEVSIRVNIDRLNINNFKELIDELIHEKIWPFKKNVAIYLGRVVAELDNDKNTTLSMKEFHKINDLTRKYLFDKYNEIIGDGKAKLRFEYPVAGGDEPCAYGVKKRCWVIDYNGKLYKCWNVIGDYELSVGTIFELALGKKELIPVKPYIDNDDYEKWGCFECNVFPICSLSCPWDYIVKEDTERRCSAWRFALGPKILDQYKIYQQSPSSFKNTPFI